MPTQTSARHPARTINLIVIHCAATPNGDALFRGKAGQPGFKTPIQVLDDMHRQRGFKRSAAFRERQNPDLTSLGYHFVIYTNGVSVTGRHLDEIGAHVTGHNANSIGICLIGTDAFTPAQWATLAALVEYLQKSYPQARVVGHRDLSPDRDGDGVVERCEWLKICPGFDVKSWLASGRQAPAKQVFKELADAAH